MKILSWQTKFSLYIIVLLVATFIIHYLVFYDPRRILLFLIETLAFVFLSVLLVTIVIQRLLSHREKRSLVEKLNMVVGAFFSEVGTKLLDEFSRFDANVDKIRDDLIVTKDWSDQEFSRVSKRLVGYDFGVDVKRVHLEELHRFLTEKRNFLARLLENPTLLEHEFFTELLRAVFHLAEELSYRKDLRKLPSTDYEHLGGDAKRAYTFLAREWLNYMKYLKNNYPYLFSLAMRTNPYDKKASPIVKT